MTLNEYLLSLAIATISPYNGDVLKKVMTSLFLSSLFIIIYRLVDHLKNLNN